MKLIKDYAWDNITTVEHKDLFPEVDNWAYENALVQNGWLTFPKGTDFEKQNGDIYFSFFNITLPNGNTFKGLPISKDPYLMNVFTSCFK